MPQMSWTFLLMELSTYVFAALMLRHALSQGRRWVATLVWGMVFGLVVELVLVGDSYQYGQFLLMFPPGQAKDQVPIWVGVGWGTILYASTWTAQRLAQPWLVRPLSAAILAVNIDLSLDPIAEQQGFWHWVDPPAPNFYAVPFDNYLGWFMIVGSYALCVRGLFRRFPPGRYWVDLWGPGLAAVGALLIVFLLNTAVAKLYAYLGGQVVVFLLVFGSACVISAYYGRVSRRDHPPSYTILALPTYYHLALLGVLLVTGAFRQDNSLTSLLVLIPLNLAAGFFAYGWVSIDRLFPSRVR